MLRHGSRRKLAHALEHTQHASVMLPSHPSTTVPAKLTVSQFVVYSVLLCSMTVALYSWCLSQVMRDTVSEPGPQNLMADTPSCATDLHTPSDIETSENKAVPAALAEVEISMVVCCPQTKRLAAPNLCTTAAEAHATRPARTSTRAGMATHESR